MPKYDWVPRYRLLAVGGPLIDAGTPVSSDPVPTGTPRVLVTGSRAWTDEAAVRTALTKAWRVLGRPFVLVHGGCPTGVDRIAADWAIEHHCAYITAERHPADWKTHGKAAGPIRNAEMVNLGADVCLAFPLGESHGTRGCMALAEKAGIPVVNHEAVTA